MKNVIIVDGQTFLRLPVIDTSLALSVCDVTPDIMPDVKKKLMHLYGDVPVTADGADTTSSRLSDAREITVAPVNDFDKQRYNVIDAMRVTLRLTRDDDGCPWDRAQTHDSIRINMIEEAYEAVDAIDRKDVPAMREELGDVLLQSLLQSDIARRGGEFDFNDVCDGLCKKLISRHTFIFGADSAGTPQEALTLWEKAKAVEKNYDSVKTQLSELPENFPALLLAQKTHKKLKKAGLDRDPKIEFDNAVAGGDLTAVIDACAALLADNGKDAEVELNKLVKGKIATIK